MKSPQSFVLLLEEILENPCVNIHVNKAHPEGTQCTISVFELHNEKSLSSKLHIHYVGTLEDAVCIASMKLKELDKKQDKEVSSWKIGDQNAP